MTPPVASECEENGSLLSDYRNFEMDQAMHMTPIPPVECEDPSFARADDDASFKIPADIEEPFLISVEIHGDAWDEGEK